MCFLGIIFEKEKLCRHSHASIWLEKPQGRIDPGFALKNFDYAQLNWLTMDDCMNKLVRATVRLAIPL